MTTTVLAGASTRTGGAGPDPVLFTVGGRCVVGGVAMLDVRDRAILHTEDVTGLERCDD